MKSTAPAAVRGARAAVDRGASRIPREGSELRKGLATDLAELMRLETTCFEPWRQDSRRVIRESLSNPRHEIWVFATAEGQRLMACVALRFRFSMMRIYSIATDPECQGAGLGGLLMDFARNRAVDLGVTRISLEADAARTTLLSWYERLGFSRETLLKDFYAPGRDAWRMELQMTGAPVALRPTD